MASAVVLDTPFSFPPPSPSPLDPNFAPPTRPPSALSTTSDASFFELYEGSGHASPTQAGPSSQGPEHLPRRTVFSTIRRHGQQCLLCGRSGSGELVVVRAVLQHADQEHDDGQRESRDPISTLKSLGFLPPGYGRDDWTNLMTLCRPHAEAYDQGVWRWLPGSALREELATATPSAHTEMDAKTPSVRPGALANDQDRDGDVAMAEITVDPAEDVDAPETVEDSKTLDNLSLAVHYESAPAETLVDDGISGDMRNPEISFKPVELPSFDVVVFRPESMPALPATAGPSPVWRDWKKLTLNPYVAFSAALQLLRESGAKGDAAVAQVRAECSEIGQRWEAHLPRKEPKRSYSDVLLT